MLDDIRISSPCPVDWNAMAGDEQVRFCSRCQKQVYNLSSLTRQQAEQLLSDFEIHPCVRLYQRADGTAMTSDCPDRKDLKTRRWIASCGALVLLLLLGIVGYVGIQASPGGAPMAFLRRVEPFRTVMDWLDPLPPPPARLVMGDW